MQLAEVEAKLDAERFHRNKAINAVQSRQDQDMDLVREQFAATHAKVDAVSTVVEAKLVAEREAREAERKQDANSMKMHFNELDSKLVDVLVRCTLSCTVVSASSSIRIVRLNLTKDLQQLSPR